MNFLALAILLLLVLNIDGIHAQNIENDLANRSIPDEEIRSSSSSSKIHSILIQWQESEDPQEFAKNNNLSSKGDKVKVYIHLESVESISNIPSEIEVAASDEKIAVAYVTSEQLDKLSELDIVERITLPDLVRIPPIPKVETPKTQPQPEDQPNYLIWLVIGGIIIFTLAVLLKKRPQAQ